MTHSWCNFYVLYPLGALWLKCQSISFVYKGDRTKQTTTIKPHCIEVILPRHMAVQLGINEGVKTQSKFSQQSIKQKPHNIWVSVPEKKNNSSWRILHWNSNIYSVCPDFRILHFQSCDIIVMSAFPFDGNNILVFVASLQFYCYGGFVT